MSRRRARIGDESGSSLIEVLVAVILLSGLITVVAATSVTGARALQTGGSDTDYWAALSLQAESLLHDGHDVVASGSATVGGFPMSWTVSGGDPKTVTLIGTRRDLSFGTVQDTVLLVLAHQ